MSDSTDREKEIFNQALEMPSAEARNAFLQGACGQDHELRNQIEALLRAYASADGFIPDKGLKETIRVGVESSERPGTIIGRYKLLQQIGEGGMGVVYMAEQTEPVVRKVALKIIKLGMDTRNVIARFEAERQALALMDHPNIAKVLDAGATDSGRPYFVMELVRGVPITEYCDKNKLSTKERLDLFIPVCQAIQHAHQKGIIHRDIKPSNVMVTLHDGKPVPRVIDFGIAKATNQRLTEKTLFTNYAQMIGTPAYMSPEQAEMSGLDVDTRTDVYSLGVLLYELLTGTTPFPAKELLNLGYGEMQRVIAEVEPPKPSTRLSTMEKEERTVLAKNRGIEFSALAKVFKGDLDWIVMKAIEKDRTHRYETVNGLALDVERHLKTEPIVARPASAAYRIQKLIRRNKLAFVAGAAIAVALLAGAALSAWQAVRATRAERLQSSLREQAQANEHAARQAQANETKERQNAENARLQEAAQRGRAEAQAYAADMNLVQQALAANNLGRAR
jgi:serine/threonine protein kinase